MLAYDNTAPLATGVALANLSNQTATVGLILRDDAGTVLQTTSLQVPANGHSAFVLGTNYPLDRRQARHRGVRFRQRAHQRARHSRERECVYVDSGVDAVKYTVLFEPAEEGGFVVTCPALPGLVTEGDTLEEARAMAEDAIRGYIESLRKDHLPIPSDKAPVKEEIRVMVPERA